jgi:hypothetical protein
MARRISIRTDSSTVEADLIDNRTADAIWEALPFDSVANTWGDEIYFAVPVTLELENGREVVEAGDIAYWPPGKAFCAFFGPTPVSKGDEIRAASEVTVFGRLVGDPGVLRSVKAGEKIFVEKGLGAGGDG